MIRKAFAAAAAILVMGCTFPYSEKAGSVVYLERDYGCREATNYLGEKGVVVSCDYSPVERRYVVNVRYRSTDATFALGAIIGAILSADQNANNSQADLLIVYEKGVYAGYVDLLYLKSCYPFNANIPNDVVTKCILDSIHR